MGPSRLTRTGLMVGAIAALIGCADAGSPDRFINPDASLAAISTPGDGVADHEFFEVCKEYTEGSGPDVIIDIAGPAGATSQATLASGECENVCISGPNVRHHGYGAGSSGLHLCVCQVDDRQRCHDRRPVCSWQLRVRDHRRLAPDRRSRSVHQHADSGRRRRLHLHAGLLEDALCRRAGSV